MIKFGGTVSTKFVEFVVFLACNAPLAIEGGAEAPFPPPPTGDSVHVCSSDISFSDCFDVIGCILMTCPMISHDFTSKSNVQK